MLNDVFGRPIKVNHTVAYPVRRGAKMWMNKLKVTQIEEASLKGYSGVGRLVTVKNTENCVIGPDPSEQPGGLEA